MTPTKGISYLETVVAVTIMGIIGTSFISVLPTLLSRSRAVDTRYDLAVAADYVGNYVHNWVNAPNKSPSFNAYIDGDQLGTNTEKRVNSLHFTDPITTIPDTIKTTITFHETNRIDRAVLKIAVWEDIDNNDAQSATENAITFSTIISDNY